MNDQPLLITRRGFVFGISAAVGGLVLGFKSAAAQTGATQAAATTPELTAWVVIEPDDTVVIRVARSEMGQGIFTSLPMLVAEELDCVRWPRLLGQYFRFLKVKFLRFRLSAVLLSVSVEMRWKVEMLWLGRNGDLVERATRDCLQRDGVKVCPR
jgi:hypothetical protein